MKSTYEKIIPEEAEIVEANGYIQQIFELYNTENALQQAKTIRNSIIHRR